MSFCIVGLKCRGFVGFQLLDVEVLDEIRCERIVSSDLGNEGLGLALRAGRKRCRRSPQILPNNQTKSICTNLDGQP